MSRNVIFDINFGNGSDIIYVPTVLLLLTLEFNIEKSDASYQKYIRHNYIYAHTKSNLPYNIIKYFIIILSWIKY